MIRKTLHSRIRGFSLVEMIVYVTLLTMLVAVVIGILISVINSFRNIEATLDIQRNASNAMDRIVREIQGANDVNAGASLFDVQNGSLSLTTAGVVRTINLSGGEIILSEDGAEIGALTGSDVSVDGLVFSHTPGAVSDLVRIQMTVSSGDQNTIFYNSAVVRGSY